LEPWMQYDQVIEKMGFLAGVVHQEYEIQQ